MCIHVFGWIIYMHHHNPFKIEHSNSDGSIIQLIMPSSVKSSNRMGIWHTQAKLIPSISARALTQIERWLLFLLLLLLTNWKCTHTHTHSRMAPVRGAQQVMSRSNAVRKKKYLTCQFRPGWNFVKAAWWWKNCMSKCKWTLVWVL